MLTGLMPHLSKHSSESGVIHSSVITHTRHLTADLPSPVSPAVAERIIKGHCEITAAFVQRSLLFTARIEQQKQINSSGSRRMFVKQQFKHTRHTDFTRNTCVCYRNYRCEVSSLAQISIFYPKSQKKEIRNQRK